MSGWRPETKEQHACTVHQKESERRPLTDHSRAELARRRCHVAAAGCHWPPGCCSACITGANSLRGLCRGRHPVPSRRRSANQVPGRPANGRWPVPEALRDSQNPKHVRWSAALQKLTRHLGGSARTGKRLRRREKKMRLVMQVFSFFRPDPVHASFLALPPMFAFCRPTLEGNSFFADPLRLPSHPLGS